MSEKKTGLNFEYCECGCHCYVAEFGSRCFTIFWDLKKSYRLFHGHGFGALIKDCTSMEQAEKIANEFAFKELSKLAGVFGFEIE